MIPERKEQIGPRTRFCKCHTTSYKDNKTSPGKSKEIIIFVWNNYNWEAIKQWRLFSYEKYTCRHGKHQLIYTNTICAKIVLYPRKAIKSSYELQETYEIYSKIIFEKLRKHAINIKKKKIAAQYYALILSKKLILTQTLFTQSYLFPSLCSRKY